jgi:hypothetical protein
MVTSMLQQQFYHMFLFGNKVGTRPTKVDLLLGVASCSPNLDKFVKSIYNVVFASPLHSKGIILEAKTCSMFVKRKLDGNSHKLDKGIYIITILAMTNCLVPSTHQSLDPLCILFSTPQPNVGNTIQNNSYKGTPTNATLLRSRHVPTTPLEMVTQFGVPMGENYVPLDHWHLQRTTNTTKITCCAMVYVNNAS